MCQTKKGNQYYFGMKGHIGVDSQTKLIHSVIATPANTHDSQGTALFYLLHEEDTTRHLGRQCLRRGQAT